MTVNEYGKKIQVPKWLALIKSTFASAVKGDNAARKILFDLIRSLPKNAFQDEDDEVFTYRIGRAQMDALEQFIAEAEEYGRQDSLSDEQ